jgi:hypothetical protein
MSDEESRSTHEDEKPNGSAYGMADPIVQTMSFRVNWHADEAGKFERFFARPSSPGRFIISRELSVGFSGTVACLHLLDPHLCNRRQLQQKIAIRGSDSSICATSMDIPQSLLLMR